MLISATVTTINIDNHEDSMSPYKLPWMSKDEINTLVSTQYMCRIAFNGEDYPYLAPFRYIQINGVLYFHFTDYGKKMKLLKQDNRACVQIEKYTPDLSSYQFVSYRGHLVKLEDSIEQAKAVKLFRETGEKTVSPVFLAAHGFDPVEGWAAFTGDKLVIMKLVNIVERIGLKSP